jgi:hypothetical protein
MVHGKTDECLVCQSLLYRNREQRDSPSSIFMAILNRFAFGLSVGCGRLPHVRLVDSHVTRIVGLLVREGVTIAASTRANILSK